MLPAAWIMNFFIFELGLNLWEIPKRSSREFEGQRLWPPLKGEHLDGRGLAGLHLFSPKGKLLGSYVVHTSGLIDDLDVAIGVNYGVALLWS